MKQIFFGYWPSVCKTYSCFRHSPLADCPDLTGMHSIISPVISIGNFSPRVWSRSQSICCPKDSLYCMQSDLALTNPCFASISSDILTMISQLHEATKTPSEYTQSQRLRNSHAVSVSLTICTSKQKNTTNFATYKRVSEGF